MAFQKKKIQIAVALLLIFRSAWGYHTAVVVQELTLDGGDDKLKKAVSKDENFLKCVNEELDKKGQCHNLLENPHDCDDSSEDDPKDGVKNSLLLAQTKEKKFCDFLCECDYFKKKEWQSLSTEELKAKQGLEEAMNYYHYQFRNNFDKIEFALTTKRLIDKKKNKDFPKLSPSLRVNKFAALFPTITNIETGKEPSSQILISISQRVLSNLHAVANGEGLVPLNVELQRNNYIINPGALEETKIEEPNDRIANNEDSTASINH